MHSASGSSPLPDVQITPSSGWLWRWAAIGLLAVVALAILDATAWVFALALMAWGIAAAVWFQRDELRFQASVRRVGQAPEGVLSASDTSCASSELLSHPAISEAEQEALRYAISHDLRAPLRVVDGFTRILKEDYGQLLDKVGNDHLDRVLAASGRMNAMIDAILAQTQLAGSPVERVAVDVSALAREVADEQLTVWRAPMQPELVVLEGLHAQADPVLLRRVLENLVGNALKYSAKVAQPRVEVGAVPATDPPVFYVRDNGAGFDMQHADKLFGMFQRLHSAKDFPGNGVGLAGVQNIVRRHGGRIWAEARPGEGACFYFTLEATLTAQQRHLPSE